jgi:hypothetical protein
VFPDAAASNPSLFYLSPGRRPVSAAALHARLIGAFKREMLRFAALSPEVVMESEASAAAPRKPLRKVSSRRRQTADDLRAALAAHLLPGGGWSSTWLPGTLDGSEPVRLPLTLDAEAVLSRTALLGGFSGEGELAVTIRVLPPSAARAALGGTRAVFDRVTAARAAGAMPEPLLPRFTAPMPPRPPGEGAKVAGGAVPRYERTAPEVADATPGMARPGV